MMITKPKTVNSQKVKWMLLTQNNELTMITPFLIDLTDDMRKFWRSETDVVVALRREYPKLDITVSKTWKGQTLIRPLSNDSQFLLYNMHSLRGKPIAFLQMDAWHNFLTAILCKVPHALSEELSEEVVPEIAKATRLTC